MLHTLGPSKAERKFGTAVCSCGSEFIKHRHGQKFCSVQCKNEAAAKRAGRVSRDPRFTARREARKILEKRQNRPVSYPYSGNGCKQGKLYNKINGLEEPFSASSTSILKDSWPVDLIGGRHRPSRISPDLLKTVIETELSTPNGSAKADPAVLDHSDVAELRIKLIRRDHYLCPEQEGWLDKLDVKIERGTLSRADFDREATILTGMKNSLPLQFRKEEAAFQLAWPDFFRRRATADAEPEMPAIPTEEYE